MDDVFVETYVSLLEQGWEPARDDQEAFIAAYKRLSAPQPVLQPVAEFKRPDGRRTGLKRTARPIG